MFIGQDLVALVAQRIFVSVGKNVLPRLLRHELIRRNIVTLPLSRQMLALGDELCSFSKSSFA